MYHFIGLAFGLATLGLVSAIYFSLALSRSDSWSRGDIVQSILLALLTGMFPLSTAILAKNLWLMFTDDAGPISYFGMGMDLVGVGLIAAALMVFGATVRATSLKAKNADNVSPLPTRPSSPPSKAHGFKKAA